MPRPRLNSYLVANFVLWALTTQPDTLTALLVTPIWFIVLAIAWLVLRRRPTHLARYEAFHADLEAEAKLEAEARRAAAADTQ